MLPSPFRRRTSANPSQRAFRPRLEALEDRATPTISVTGIASFDNTGNLLVGTNPAVDSHGNVYGTSNNIQSNPTTLGTVFEVAAGTKAIKTLASFNGNQGAWMYYAYQQPGLAVDSNGNVFGTTRGGGDESAGSIFEIAAGSHTVTTLASFDVATTGLTPNGGLLLAGGVLYGTAHAGGANGDGTVFSFPIGGNAINVVGTFDGTNGTAPNPGMLLSGGTLYGTSTRGGSNFNTGTVFSVPAAGGTITALAAFSNQAQTTGNLVLSGGFLYGIDSDIYDVPVAGGTISVAATFNGTTEGGIPVGGLFQDGSTIVGVTETGGSIGEGLIYSFTPSSNAITPLVTFKGANSTNSGSTPLGGLSIDNNGNVYGISQGEGSQTLIIWEMSGLPAPPPPPQNQPPAITSPNSATFAENVPVSFTATATGTPTPTLTETGTLPAGVTFANGQFGGSPATGTSGVYNLTITASNGIGSPATQSFTLDVIVSGTITGTVFRDFNLTGMQDIGEPGLAGQTVYLDENNNGAFDAGEPSAASAANGTFTFNDFAPGAYQVRQVLLGGVLQSAPTSTNSLSGSYSITVAAHQTVSDVNFGDVLTSITVPLTLPANTPFPKHGDANADYVEAIFRAVLNRTADSGGLAFWSGQLTGGTSTRLQVVQGIRNSPEHFGQEVDAFYLTLLGRPADSPGRAFWVGQFESGLPEERMAFAFLNSSEYVGKGDKFFVDSMYQSLLGRAFDPAGEAFFFSQLGDDAAGNPTGSAPTLTHAQVVTDFLYSTESLQRLVEGYYEVFLLRQADPGGLNSWVANLQQGLPFLTIGEEFVASDEFYNNAKANQ